MANGTYPRVLSRSVLLFVLTFVSQVNCKTHSAPAIYAFGDSLFDSGNNNKLPTLARANFRPYGVDFIDGPSGRFTNNETFADIIAQFLGLPMPPAYESLHLRSFKSLTGVNYASGGAGILPETDGRFGGSITFGKQVDKFQRTVEKVLQPQFGNGSHLRKYLAESIFLVCIGTNDYIQNYLVPFIYRTSKIYTPQAYPKFLLEDNLSQEIERLYKLGARKMVIFEIGPIGCMPSSLKKRRPETGCVEDYNQLVSYFNTQLNATLHRLASTLPGSKLINGKIHDFFKSMVTHPAKFGLKETKEPCCIVGASGMCIPFTKPCIFPSEHLWWDGLHPTSEAHSIIAKDCYSGTSTCSPMNIRQLARA